MQLSVAVTVGAVGIAEGDVTVMLIGQFAITGALLSVTFKKIIHSLWLPHISVATQRH